MKPGNASISLRRLVHLATRNWIKKEEQFPRYIEMAGDNRQLWREYLPHALALLNETEFRKRIDECLDYIRNVARCLDNDGRNDEAETLLVQVVESRKQMLMPEHPITVGSVEDLAWNYKIQGKLRKQKSLSCR